MTSAPVRLAVAMAIAATSLAHAGDPVHLTKEETQKAPAGESNTDQARVGGSAVIFFAAEGRMTFKMTDSPRNSPGTWSVDDERRECIKVTSGAAGDGCRHLYETDTGDAMKTGSGEILPVDTLE